MIGSIGKVNVSVDVDRNALRLVQDTRGSDSIAIEPAEINSSNESYESTAKGKMNPDVFTFLIRLFPVSAI